jgi:uncharacterized membrane protein YdfJ with MMPL/SSD domain
LLFGVLAVWDRVAGTVTHRRSWVIALIAAGASVFIAPAGPNIRADKSPLQLSPSAESARAAALYPRARYSRRIVRGLGDRSVITSAGIVMAAVFCVLAVLPLTVLTQLGAIVGLGILLDAFVVRTVLVPALFTVIGPRIWWPAKVDDTVR